MAVLFKFAIEDSDQMLYQFTFVENGSEKCETSIGQSQGLDQDNSVPANIIDPEDSRIASVVGA